MTEAAYFYAIRLKPGAGKPHRFYPGANVEVALRQAGVEFYLPVELKATMHKRTKELLDKRWPLIPGYCFIPERHNINWKALTKIDYVSCAVHSKGTPLRIRGSDIERIKDIEEAIRAKYIYDKAAQLQRQQAAAHRMTSREAKRMFPEGAKFRVMDSHAMFGGKEARVLAATGRNTIRAVIEMLGGAVTAELGIDYLEDAA
jgi:transcription antitermination factor NusG